MGNGGELCERFLLGFGDTHGLGVLLIPGMDQRLYINDESNRNSHTLPLPILCSCLTSELCSVSKSNGIVLEYFFVRECFYISPNSQTFAFSPLTTYFEVFEYAKRDQPTIHEARYIP